MRQECAQEKPGTYYGLNVTATRHLLFTHSGSLGNIILIVRRQTGTRERENGQIVRCNAAWGG